MAVLKHSANKVCELITMNTSAPLRELENLAYIR